VGISCERCVPHFIENRYNTRLIEKKQLKDIANWMKVEHPTELPEVLQGIFFINGNVLPDDCLTMYSSDWNADPLTDVIAARF
jgi:hypothetical protein